MWFSAEGEGLSSGRAFKGFLKKMAYIVLVGVAWGVDFLVINVAGTLGDALSWGAHFGTLVVCYIVLTEGISILENIGRMGVKVPFLSSALEYFRGKIEKEGGR